MPAAVRSAAGSCRIWSCAPQHGPVTVLVLREESLTRPIRVREGEFRGSLVPAGPGSIAIFGDTRSDLSEITARLETAVEWIELPGAGQ